MGKKFRIAGTGCALADFVYNGINFQSREFLQYTSKKQGDGGISPGGLVFTAELEKFAAKPYPQIISEISHGKKAQTVNVGGPSLVSLIHAAQMLGTKDFEVYFYGISGDDETGSEIRKILKKTPVNASGYLQNSKKPTPFTHVLSDPGFNEGQGERSFINNIGAAWDLTPGELPDNFFTANMICFGGTALTPNIHDKLHILLKKAKENGALTLVNTVYDFRNEKENPGKPWPLGNTQLSFPHIDLLIVDNEEALKISGKDKIKEAYNYFAKYVPAFIITRGPESTLFYSNGDLFAETRSELPVSSFVSEQIRSGKYKGDTTGCGDNFVGGVIYSIARQISQETVYPELKTAVEYGICSGGFTCSYIGGTYNESAPEQKKEEVEKLFMEYQKQ